VALAAVSQSGWRVVGVYARNGICEHGVKIALAKQQVCSNGGWGCCRTTASLAIGVASLDYSGIDCLLFVSEFLALPGWLSVGCLLHPLSFALPHSLCMAVPAILTLLELVSKPP